VIVIGLICLVLGFFLGIQILWIAGIVLLLIGVVLWFSYSAGGTGWRSRRYY
jgi:uncharacterized membrane protein